MKSSTLSFKTLNIPAASLGKLSPLADIGNDTYIRAPIATDGTIPEDEMKYIGKGMIETLLPYRIQNNYDRKRVPAELPVAVLENEYLRATFLTSLGGRLYSLFDKKAKRELLYKNPVFQPANLALRNAWFSGGIEWNVGIKGHNPLTCSPLFARRLTAKDGEEMLEMFEYERIRGIVYSMRFRLSDDLLCLKVTIENPNDVPTDMYWWSNIAVTENEHTRVIAPTESAIRTTYRDGNYMLGLTEYPSVDGIDASYSARHSTAVDYFYRVPGDEKKWVASVEEDGYGFIELSSDLLKGKKLFLWGKEKGGPHWNEWLSDGSANYIEIQSGLLQTQMEHFPIKEHSTIIFTEAFGAINVPKESAMSENYSDAKGAVEAVLDDRFKALFATDFESKETGAFESLGSGFGWLEERVQGKRLSNTVDFPEIKDGECAEFYTLYKTGALPLHAPDASPLAFVKGEHWRTALLASPESWYRSYQLGVLNYALGDVAGAKKHYQDSLKLEESSFAYRDLAMLARNYDHDASAALSLMQKAFALLPSDRNLAVDYAETLIAAKQYEKWLEIYENDLSHELKSSRLKMLAAHCAAELGMSELAIGYLTNDFLMPDLKEGEFSVFAIWLKAHADIMKKAGRTDLSEAAILAEYPLPYELDFRMH